MSPAKRITAEAIRDAFALALREEAQGFIAQNSGRNLGDFKWAVCEAIECDQRTLESWMARETAPGTTHEHRLYDHFGEDFANKVMKLSRLVCARIGDAGLVENANRLASAEAAIREAAQILADHEGREAGE